MLRLSRGPTDQRCEARSFGSGPHAELECNDPLDDSFCRQATPGTLECL